MVVDSSALIALIVREPLEEWVYRHLEANLPRLQMSTVNYTEVLICVVDRFPGATVRLSELIADHVVRLTPPTTLHAELAAAARLRYPLNLGDCFAYALAKEQNEPLLTLDRDFRNCDIDVILPDGSTSSTPATPPS